MRVTAMNADVVLPRMSPFVEPDLVEHPRVQTVRRVGQEAAEEPDDDRRHEHRHQDQRGDDVAPPPGLVDRERESDPERHLKADGEHEEHHRPQPAPPHRAIADKARPVV